MLFALGQHPPTHWRQHVMTKYWCDSKVHLWKEKKKVCCAFCAFARRRAVLVEKSSLASFYFFLLRSQEEYLWPKNSLRVANKQNDTFHTKLTSHKQMCFLLLVWLGSSNNCSSIRLFTTRDSGLPDATWLLQGFSSRKLIWVIFIQEGIDSCCSAPNSSHF